MKYSLLLLSLTACVVGCTRPPGQVDISSAEEYHVIATVIDSLYRPSHQGAPLIFIDSTIVQSSVDSTIKMFKRGDSASNYLDLFATDSSFFEGRDSVELRRDFDSKNRQRWILFADSLRPKTQLIFQTLDQVNSVFALTTGNSWAVFRDKYHTNLGFMEVSRVGFNSKLNKAVVYVERYAGYENAEGTFVFLLKLNGQWIIHRQYMKWIS